MPLRRCLGAIGLGATLLGCHDSPLQPVASRDAPAGIAALLHDPLLQLLASQVGDASVATLVDDALRSAPDAAAAGLAVARARIDARAGAVGDPSSQALLAEALSLTLDRVAAALTVPPEQSQ